MAVDQWYRTRFGGSTGGRRGLVLSLIDARGGPPLANLVRGVDELPASLVRVCVRRLREEACRPNGRMGVDRVLDGAFGDTELVVDGVRRGGDDGIGSASCGATGRGTEDADGDVRLLDALEVKKTALEGVVIFDELSSASPARCRQGNVRRKQLSGRLG